MPRSTVARQAILVAIAGLIPVPFLDSWVQGRLRAEMVRAIAQHHDTPLDHTTVRSLSSVQSSLLLGCVMGAVWWPIKRLIRKVVYVLTVKDAIDALADTFIRGEMVREAFAAGLLPSETARVCQAMDLALSRHTRSPLWGPKTRGIDSVNHDSDTTMVRMMAKTADRGGAAAALHTFRQYLSDLDQLPSSSKGPVR